VESAAGSRSDRRRGPCALLAGTAVLALALLAAVPVGANEDDGWVYRIGPADVLKIDVYDETEMSSTYTVDADGLIVFPLIGELELSGRSPSEAQRLITQLLQADYMYDPKVSVVVQEYRSKSVKLLGNVVRPGIFYLDGPLRLFELLSRAEGMALQQGEIRRGQMARIVREVEQPDGGGDGEGSGRERIHIDLYDLLVLGLEEFNVLLEDGDVVYVSRTESIHVVGEVLRPGSFPHEAGMTVLKAITLAGGTSKKASLKGTVILRIVDGREKRIKASVEDTLEAEDIVEVPLSFW